MLDGSGYGAAKTTRDREIAQVSVLSGLGWNILRVWCMDWWDNSDKEIKRILKKLKDIRDSMELCQGIQIMPYHKIGSYKYNFLDRAYVCSNIGVPTKETIENWNKLIE